MMAIWFVLWFSETFRSEEFFLVADDYRNQMYHIAPDLQESSISAIPTPQHHRPIALAYDPVEQRVYWSTLKLRTIFSTSLLYGNLRVVMAMDNSELAI